MLDEKGYYVIKDYDKKPPFSSFLAGIAGTEGRPLWTFFVNRAQGISSFGIRDKNGCMMEFYPANEAYKWVYTNGFRTFVKFGSDNAVYEPFSASTQKYIQRTMRVKNNELQIEEINSNLGLKLTVTYYTVPNECFGALARKLKIENLTNQAKEVEILDGMPAILPYGTKLKDYKEIANTLRSWMQGEVLWQNMAVYKLRASSEDVAEVKSIEGMYFYKAFDENKTELMPIIDPQQVFDYDTSHLNPIGFLNGRTEGNFSKKERCVNKVPSAFCGAKKRISPYESAAIYSYIGYVYKAENLNQVHEAIGAASYFNKHLEVANQLIEQITAHVATKTAYPLWDAYIKQSYLDNVLRGGYPLQLGEKTSHTYYVFSRKHGDLERDYNFFVVEPNYYSQGNANFRDVCQNRRLDTYLHPETRDDNIKLFCDLIQIDGYNPLIISGKKFVVKNREALKEIEAIIGEAYTQRNKKFFMQEFTAGELYSYLKEELHKRPEEIQKAMNVVIDRCEENIIAEFGEGFWIDHWTYILDLIEQFLDVYPDQKHYFLTREKKYRYFNSSKYILPRSERYVLTKEGLRQHQFIRTKEDKILGEWLITEKGTVYTSTLMGKLIALALIKFTAIDPFGVGLEMEAGKPGWNDAMNGLPGILGSSSGELFELKRLLQFIRQNNESINEALTLPEPFKDLIEGIEQLLRLFDNQEISQIEYWHAVEDLKEVFREKTKYRVLEEEYAIAPLQIISLIDKMLKKIDTGIAQLKALKETVLLTFCYYQADEYIVESCNSGKQVIKPTHFTLHVLPEFLEGPVRYLKTQLSMDEKLKLYETVKASEIYDQKLKMYKLSASLEKVPYQIGRSRIFTPGWLERESIFMHMSFKYLLELIKNGLYEAFFEDMKHGVPAFMDAEIYGRSILENSSFIASSVNPDKALHGRGFVARLSGTTVEFLNIWKIMMTGYQLFDYQKGMLQFKLQPILTKDFFDENDEVQTTILGGIRVIYSNPEKKDTFGKKGGRITKLHLLYKDGKEAEVKGNTLFEEQAEAVRSKQIVQINAVIS